MSKKKVLNYIEKKRKFNVLKKEIDEIENVNTYKDIIKFVLSQNNDLGDFCKVFGDMMFPNYFSFDKCDVYLLSFDKETDKLTAKIEMYDQYFFNTDTDFYKKLTENEIRMMAVRLLIRYDWWKADKEHSLNDFFRYVISPKDSFNTENLLNLDGGRILSDDDFIELFKETMSQNPLSSCGGICDQFTYCDDVYYIMSLLYAKFIRHIRTRSDNMCLVHVTTVDKFQYTYLFSSIADAINFYTKHYAKRRHHVPTIFAKTFSIYVTEPEPDKFTVRLTMDQRYVPMEDEDFVNELTILPLTDSESDRILNDVLQGKMRMKVKKTDDLNLYENSFLCNFDKNTDFPED